MTTAVLTRNMLRREQVRYGGSQDEARLRLARRLKLAPGTLYNLARHRLKRIDHSLREQIVQYAIRDIQQEIARLNHELQIARQMGVAQTSGMVAQVEALKADFEKLYVDVMGVPR